jgi:hypothetical protein
MCAPHHKAAAGVPILCIEMAPASNPEICKLRTVPDDYQAGRLLAEQFCTRQKAPTANVSRQLWLANAGIALILFT